MCNPSNVNDEPKKIEVNSSPLRWVRGMIYASIFTLSYILAPSYILSAIIALLLRFPNGNISFLYSLPLLISIMTPARPMPHVVGLLTPMLDYFQFEQIIEDEETLRMNLDKGKNYILAAQPHGVLSLCGICSCIHTDVRYRKINTAVASSLLTFPILKNVMGIFQLVDASAKSLKKILREKNGIEGSVVLYVGGIAELFKCSREKEILHLSQRKGFIKLALREGVDIIPVYLFGNTSVLSVVRTNMMYIFSSL